MTGSEAVDEQPRRPLLRVVRGAPDDVELAALTAVVAGLASAGADAGTTSPRPRSTWADPAARLRHPPRPGPGAWRASALPR
ncbi:acyl-CoA carboxylase subunit epsilon [Streptoalloteichus hindustanus]|uniref:Acyl-CoA carboxylase epsilon subunit n=1 Tax=Streptoalloteichus hindustanus TaxID=2017 RepID=A0A1M5K6M1_STRHI|nr:acyl-CoA carboxylase subunit epsilon [Streptoalloteichus hindustanus]SHG48361.1 Acyl-CoA carboxylase epsilon subunit [Streptoalloteichus hindustanus]